MKVEQQLKVTDQATIRTGVHSIVIAIKRIQSLDAEIEQVELRQKEATANLDLNIQIEKARQQQSVDLTLLDDAARKLYEAFHSNG